MESGTDRSVGVDATGLGPGDESPDLLPRLAGRDGLVRQLDGDLMRPGPRDDLLGARQGAHRLRDAVQRRGPTLLLAFALLPGLPEILGNLTAAEDVGMPANQLVGDPPGDVVEGEAPLVLGYLGVEVDLKQQVAKLLQKVGVGSGMIFGGGAVILLTLTVPVVAFSYSSLTSRLIAPIASSLP